jgi:hypothetical protein
MAGTSRCEESGLHCDHTVAASNRLCVRYTAAGARAPIRADIHNAFIGPVRCLRSSARRRPLGYGAQPSNLVTWLWRYSQLRAGLPAVAPLGGANILHVTLVDIYRAFSGLLRLARRRPLGYGAQPSNLVTWLWRYSQLRAGLPAVAPLGGAKAGAGGGSRTLLSCLGSTHNTDILRPQRTPGLKPPGRHSARIDRKSSLLR